MTLNISTLVLGPIDNNTYFLKDSASRQAAVIDPSFEPEAAINLIRQEGLSITGIWLTHGHFDHFIGVFDILKNIDIQIPVLIHKADSEMFKAGGLGSKFGFEIPAIPANLQFIEDMMELKVGDYSVTALHTPGHSAGHIAFYDETNATVFSGDLIFRQGVGRTDLPGSDQDALLHSIYTRILTLPGETVILPGHGDSTTVADEVEYNPYLN